MNSKHPKDKIDNPAGSSIFGKFADGNKEVDNMTRTDLILDVLKKNKLSITDARTKILDLFYQSEGALSHATIEKELKSADRVTIYRTLQSFLEKGIIHTIPTDDNSIQYALCKSGECHAGEHHDNHVHFICKKCNVVYCLDHTTVPQVKLPAGFQMQELEMVVKGVCEKCAQSAIADMK